MWLTSINFVFRVISSKSRFQHLKFPAVNNETAMLGGMLIWMLCVSLIVKGGMCKKQNGCLVTYHVWACYEDPCIWHTLQFHLSILQTDSLVDHICSIMVVVSLLSSDVTLCSGTGPQQWHLNLKMYVKDVLRVRSIFCDNWLMTSVVLISLPLYTAKNRCAATCIRATMTPNRSLFGIPRDTSLIFLLFHTKQ